MAADRPRLACLADGCANLEEFSRGRSTGGLCAAHRKQKRRQRELGEVQVRFRPSRSARDRLLAAKRNLLDAALSYADADALDDDEHAKAEARVIYASRQLERARAAFVELMGRKQAHAAMHANP